MPTTWRSKTGGLYLQPPPSARPCGGSTGRTDPSSNDLLTREAGPAPFTPVLPAQAHQDTEKQGDRKASRQGDQIQDTARFALDWSFHHASGRSNVRDRGRELHASMLSHCNPDDRVLGQIHLDHVPHELDQRLAVEHAWDRIIDVAEPSEHLAVDQSVQEQDPVVVVELR